MSLSITLSRKQNNNKQRSSYKLLFLVTFLALVGFQSVNAQRSAVVTTKVRKEVTKTVVDATNEVKTAVSGKESRASKKKLNTTAEITNEAEKAKIAADIAALEVKTAAAKTSTAVLAIESAETYLGTRYRYAGSTRSGIDCSGLMLRAFEEAGIDVPRTSRELATTATRISKEDAKPGDLVFFATRGRGVSHVGLVTTVEDGVIEFIHSSSSQGVIKSKLTESYWARTFLNVGRLDETK